MLSEYHYSTITNLRYIYILSEGAILLLLVPVCSAADEGWSAAAGRRSRGRRRRVPRGTPRSYPGGTASASGSTARLDTDNTTNFFKVVLFSYKFILPFMGKESWSLFYFR